MNDAPLPANYRRNDLVEFVNSVKHLDAERLREALELYKDTVIWHAKEEFEHSLARAQHQFKRVERDKKNSHLGNKYPSYTAYIKACEDALHEEGISVTFGTEATPDPNVTKVKLFLSKGMYTRESSLPAVASNLGSRGGAMAMNESQARSSALTYTQKDLLRLALGLAPEESTDDDGNAAGVSFDDVNRLFEAFAKHDVGAERIHARFRRINRATLEELRKIYLRVHRGESADKFFPPAPPTRGNEGLKAALNPPAAAPEPSPPAETPEDTSDAVQGRGDEPLGDSDDPFGFVDRDEDVEEPTSVDMGTKTWAQIVDEMLAKIRRLRKVETVRDFRLTNGPILDQMRSGYDEGYRQILTALTEREETLLNRGES